MRRGLLGVVLVWCVGQANLALAACAGDCDGDGTVTIAELVSLVALVLGGGDPTSCLAADADGDGQVSVADAIAAVQATLNGCGAARRCPVISVTADSGATLSGPGLAMQPNGAFDIVTGYTNVTTTNRTRAAGSVLLHRYAADGSPNGTTQTIAAPAQVVLAPRVTPLNDGGGVVAWGEADPRTFGLPITRLVTRRYGSRGGVQGNAVTAVRAAAQHELSAPGVAADSSGNALFTWMDRQSVDSGDAVFRAALRRQRPNGFDAAQSLGCFGNPLSLSAGAFLGAACVAIDVQPMQVVLRAFELVGTAPQGLGDFSSSGPYGTIGAAASGDRIAATWLQPSDDPLRESRVLVQLMGLDGRLLTPPIDVGTVLDTLVPPAVALQADGGFAVAFGENPLRVQRYNANGTTAGEPIVVENTRVDELALGSDDNGDLVVAWRWRDILALRIPAPGGPACAAP